MIRIFIAASMVLAAASSANAQSSSSSTSGAVVNGKTVAFECAFNSSSKAVEIKVTNPNGVDKKCDMSCTYTAADKKSYEVSCKNTGVFKNANKLAACSEGSPKGGQPFTNFKAQGKCN